VIEAVLWDLGGVLCRFHPERRIHAIASACGATPGAVTEALDADLLVSLDRGTLDAAGLLTALRTRLGWDRPYDTLARAWATAFEPDDEVLAIAACVQVRSALLTNNGSPLVDNFGALLPDIAAVVDIACFSSDLGVAKPDREAFALACSRLGSPPSAVLLVDDTTANVESARSAGLDAVVFSNAAALSRELVRRNAI
jgi:glucose-1-phosphatase